MEWQIQKGAQGHVPLPFCKKKIDFCMSNSCFNLENFPKSASSAFQRLDQPLSCDMTLKKDSACDDMTRWVNIACQTNLV